MWERETQLTSGSNTVILTSISPDKKIETQRLCPFDLFIEFGWGFSSFIWKQKATPFNSDQYSRKGKTIIWKTGYTNVDCGPLVHKSESTDWDEATETPFYTHNLFSHFN